MTVGGLRSLLAPYRNKRGWLMPLTDERGRALANNGDLLMHRVLHDLCAEIEIDLSPTPEGVDFVAVPPNGALLDRFRAPDIIRERLRPHTDKPLVIFPSSAQFLRRNPKELFEGRSAPTLWILREPYSFQHLEEHWGSDLVNVGVTLALDHDVVISGSRHVPQYFPGSRGGSRLPNSLLVPRLGVEANNIRNQDGSGDSYTNRAGSPIKQAAVAATRSLPAPLLRPVRRVSTRRRIRAASIDLLSAVPNSVRARFDNEALRTATDISDTSLVGFDDYCARVADATLVVSNRLHVVIPAALLGKEAYLIDSGYHKLQGIYEHSLQHLDNLTFVVRP